MRSRERIEGSAGHVVFDSRHFPIVVARWCGVLDFEVVERFGMRLEALLSEAEASGLRFAMIVDVTRSEPPSPEVRRALVSIRSERMARVRTCIVKDFVVIDRPVLRATIKALHWIAPQQQTTPVESLDEGLRRCRDELGREGITVPLLTAIEFERP